MPKLLFFTLLSSVLFLSSCGGWTDERQSQIKNTCLGSGKYDCECYLDKIMKAYPSPGDYNKLSEEEKDKVVADCEQKVETVDENIESF